MPSNDPHVALRRNVEIKARLRDLEQARTLAAELSGGTPQVLRQTDTYFRCAVGRLKLRQFSDAVAELIAYARPNDVSPRASQYRIVPVADGESLREALSMSLGVLVVVAKDREVSHYKNVRIHLDRVEQLGTFLEFEAVLESAAHQSEGEALVRELTSRFGLLPADLIAESYSDMVLHSISQPPK
ncbi:MAG TPA: class IV adenylate cyclase [Pirellulales bacterium]|jgi:predicted adenylyl cyclase CyaB